MYRVGSGLYGIWWIIVLHFERPVAVILDPCGPFGEGVGVEGCPVALKLYVKVLSTFRRRG